MLHEHALLQQELASRAGQPRGRLLLGVVPTAVPVAARSAAMLQASHPGIAPVVRALSSQEIEVGLENLSLDMALGFTDRLKKGGPFAVLPQYTEHYFLVRRIQKLPRAKRTELRLGVATGRCDAQVRSRTNGPEAREVILLWRGGITTATINAQRFKTATTTQQFPKEVTATDARSKPTIPQPRKGIFATQPDDRDQCGNCGKLMIPTLALLNGSPHRSFCPF